MNFFGKPMTAGPNDYVWGKDELGNPIYRTPAGDAYSEQPRPSARDMIVEQLHRNGLMSDYLGYAGGLDYETTQYAPDGQAGPLNRLATLAGAIWSGLEAPGNALRGEPVTYGDVWGTALDYGVMSGAAGKPAGALGAGGIRAYHGSPHDFDRFSMDKIGTGEGAQAYGHGLYFAENEAVAQGYRDALSLDAGFSYKGREGLTREQLAEAITADYGGKYLDNIITPRGVADGVMDELIYGPSQRKLGPERAALREKLLAEIQRTDPGRMYEVQINANPDDFLDWDAPLSEQPRGIEAAKKLGLPRVFRRGEGEFQAYVEGPSGFPDTFTGATQEEAVNKAMQNLTGAHLAKGDLPSLATRTMREAGIPGIKYRDAGSRGLDGAQGTRNFVVFDDSLIEIVRKYGIAGAATLTGLSQAEIQQRMGQKSGADEIRNYLGGT